MQHERGWRQAVTITLFVAGGLFVVLVLTGLWLSFRYEPAARSPFDSGGAAPWMVSATRHTHGAAAYLFLMAIAALTFASIGYFVVRHQAARIVLPTAAGFIALAASFSGYVLPWDQLSVHAVTVGTRISGYGPIVRGDDVKYVLLGSKEIAPSTLAQWFWIHTVVLSGALLLALIAIAFLARRTRPAESVAAA
jgi:quinol-cytochrome oxidoreductase complex cytochrome b subunit